jgi:hypothetical protein
LHLLTAATAILAGLFLVCEPGGRTDAPGRFPEVPSGQEGGSGATVYGDIANLPQIEPKLHLLQDRRAQSLATVQADSPEGVGLSPLNRWDEIERTARRHKCSLDYFLGFGF